MVMDDMSVDISALYFEPPTWDQFTSGIGAVMADDQHQGSYTTEAPPYDVNDVIFNPTLFSSRIHERAQQSRALAAIGATTVNQDECEIFVMISAATAGKS